MTTRHLGIAEALREAIAEEMTRDERVFCIGEDIAVPGGWGGAFTVTLGLEKKFPDRMINTPIAELGFFGVACGAAMAGMRPIADVQYGDFLLLAADQIINNIAKMRYMSGGQVIHAARDACPCRRDRPGQPARAEPGTLLHRRARPEGGCRLQRLRRQGDPQGRRARRQSRDDLRAQAAVRLQRARAEPGAVDATSDIPEGDYTVPLDKAAVRREGSDVTILAWLLMLHYSLQAAEQLAAEGISAEVIDVRSLSPLDLETIGASVRKTGRVVIVEEGPKTGSVSAEIAASVMEEFGEYLRCPIRRVASADVPVPFTPVLENAYRPDVPRIVEAARAVMQF